MLPLLLKASLYSPKLEDNLEQKDSLKSPQVIATSKPSHAIQMPSVIVKKSVVINAKHCDRYNSLCNWSAGIASVIHPNYIQVLSLPMQLSMMVTKPFPFKPLGLVHLANNIDVHFLPEQQSELSLSTQFGELYWHKKGWVFELLTYASVEGKLAISASSFYLARLKHQPQDIDIEQTSVLDETDCSTPNRPKLFSEHAKQLSSVELELEPNFNALYKSFEFSPNTGRRYARVSGDYNPIHISAISAKVLGFKKAIVHGMHSKALCVSQMMQDIPALRQQTLSGFSIDTTFMQPIYLPSSCTLVANEFTLAEDGSHRKENKGYGFRLASSARGKTREYLRGQISFPD